MRIIIAQNIDFEEIFALILRLQEITTPMRQPKKRAQPFAAVPWWVGA
ncbi:hypothetical protein [Pandoraea sp.]